LPFFFFGTLMDRDVLEIVLGRPIAKDELTAARLRGYRRVRTATRPYPMLKPDPDGVVEGMLLMEPSSRDAARILHFENEEYVARRTTVHPASDRALKARVFFALPEMGATEEPWEPDSWASRHKGVFLRQCHEWMRDCPI
jgi:hypothetical protein